MSLLLAWFTFLGAQSNAFKASNLEAVGAGGAGGNMPPKILANHLTLSQPGGGDMFCPPHYYLPPRIVRSSYGPAKASSVSATIHDRDGRRSENLGGTSSNVVFIIYPQRLR